MGPRDSQCLGMSGLADGRKRWREKSLTVIPMLIVFLVDGVAFGQGMHTFKTEKAAQRHCPADTVVWVNTSSANYHFKGDPWYGHTQRGSYACKVEADKDGLHAWANPQ